MPTLPKEPPDALGRMKLLLDALYSLAPDAILTIDKAGTILTVSASVSEMFGYADGELIGGNVSMLMASPHRERHDFYISRFLDTGEARIIGKGRTVEARRRDGRIFPVYLRVAEVWDDGNPTFVGVIHDLTDEVRGRAREQELRFTMQHMSRVASMGELATGLAHELNQPLTAISQYLASLTHIVEAAPDDRRTALELIDKANRQAQRAGEIIRSLRRFVSLESGARRNCDIGDLVEEALRLSLLDTERERIAVAFSRDANLPPVFVESVQIQQVIHNLLRNAVYAVENIKGPWIGIRAEAGDERFVSVVVEDNGPGIAADIKDSLFERFVSGRANGLGIGLAICRSIIVAHGGRLFAEDRPGGGARMRFTLPAAL